MPGFLLSRSAMFRATLREAKDAGIAFVGAIVTDNADAASPMTQRQRGHLRGERAGPSFQRLWLPASAPERRRTLRRCANGV
ncbi:hypothetical protein GCM10011504_49280 [Siccirubricoccus deserti]|nr:hypothetical protein GCM10011504_49280 [Siccirubricoccus deserti]